VSKELRDRGKTTNARPASAAKDLQTSINGRPEIRISKGYSKIPGAKIAGAKMLGAKMLGAKTAATTIKD
jgi:hypothetical protein